MISSELQQRHLKVSKIRACFENILEHIYNLLSQNLTQQTEINGRDPRSYRITQQFSDFRQASHGKCDEEIIPSFFLGFYYHLANFIYIKNRRVTRVHD